VGAGACDRWQTKNACLRPEELYIRAFYATTIWPKKAKVEKCLEGPDFDQAGPKAMSHKMSSVLTPEGKLEWPSRRADVERQRTVRITRRLILFQAS